MKKQINPKAGETWVTASGKKVKLCSPPPIFKETHIWEDGGTGVWLLDGTHQYSPNYGDLVARFAAPINFQRVAARMARELRDLSPGRRHAGAVVAALAVYTKALKRGKK